jgi:hypothetical protein
MGWLLALLCLITGNAGAHHAYAADFEPNKYGSAKGTIVEIFYKNPHVQYYFEVKQEDGTSKTWGAIMQSIGAITRVGMTKDRLSVGEEIEVYGRMGRDDRPIIWAQTVTKSDGTVIDMGTTGPLK